MRTFICGYRYCDKEETTNDHKRKYCCTDHMKRETNQRYLDKKRPERKRLDRMENMPRDRTLFPIPKMSAQWL